VYKTPPERGVVEMGTSRFHAPLEPRDTEKQTVGCRHQKPDFCARNSMESVCAHVRTDGMCTSPPERWPTQFRRLKVLADEGESAAAPMGAVSRETSQDAARSSAAP